MQEKNTNICTYAKKEVLLQRFRPPMDKISKAQIKLVRSLQHKKFRDELGLFVAEGEKCVEELRKGFELVLLVESQESKVESQESRVYASKTEIEQMSGLRTPQGVIGVFKKRPQPSAISSQFSELVLALDGVQDPGNLGTIIRTCDWFGIHDIICSLDTADCYNPKVVQATMGALSRVRIHYVELPVWLARVKNQEPEIKIYGTLLDGKNMYEVLDSRANSQESREIIIMGNEGNGISPEVRPYITHSLYIPTYTNVKASDVIESLNVSVATAIILAEFRRP